MSEPVFLAAMGAVTPIGRDAWSSAAAVRAGVSGFGEHPYMVDTAGNPMRVAAAPWIDIDLQGSDRIAALLVPALQQALAPLADAADSETAVALALGLPSARPGLPSSLAWDLRHRVAVAFPNWFSSIAILETGHAAPLVGLQAAMRKIAEGAFDACIIAGVESLISPETLEWLEQSDQFHGAGSLNNAWGFIPGEAAGAVLVATEQVCRRLGVTPMARVLGVGRAHEPKAMKTATVCVGEGLTAAFREALSALPAGSQVTDVYCDMNGEPYRADEFGFACLRTKEFFVSASDFIAPADCWGDVSAASAPLGMVLSTIAAQKAYANGRLAFVWASSERGDRGAVLLDIPVRSRA